MVRASQKAGASHLFLTFAQISALCEERAGGAGLEELGKWRPKNALERSWERGWKEIIPTSPCQETLAEAALSEF
jgi:hypothetical protein